MISDIVISLTPLVAGIGIPAAVNPRGYKQCGLKPQLQPPGYVFGIAWTILYALYGGSCVTAWVASKRRWTPGLVSSFVSLGALVFWSLVFMNPAWCLPEYAYLAILAILGLVVGTTMIYVHEKLYLSAALLVPLIAWMTFATYLSFASIP